MQTRPDLQLSRAADADNRPPSLSVAKGDGCALAITQARGGSRIEGLAGRIAAEATVRATLDSLARGERARADRDPYDHQPASPWRYTAEEPEGAMCGAEQLVAFHGLPESEQEKFWTALRALVELIEAPARSQVVAETA